MAQMGRGMGQQHGMGQGMMGNLPGMVVQHCGVADRPPHYCELVYNVVSSVKGVRISAVTPVNDKEVMIMLVQINQMSRDVIDRIVVVGGGEDLAGATIVEGGSGSTTFHLRFVGNDLIYEQQSQGYIYSHTLDHKTQSTR